MTFNFPKLYKNIKTIKLVFLFSLSIWLFSLLRNIPPYAYGDGPEYVLMTESFYNHFSPEIKIQDVKQIIDKNSEYEKTNDIYKKDFYYAIYNSLKINYNNYDLGDKWCYFKAKNNNYYCYHFWFYSLINVPARCLTEVLSIHPIISFYITNIILILLVVAYILFLYRNTCNFNRILFSIIFIFSSVFWYIVWPHSECFSSTLLLLSILLFFDKRYFLALLFSSLASTQNPPIFILSLYYIIKIFWSYKINIRLLFKIFICSVWLLLPSVFYYILYGKPNLIIDRGYLDSANITWTRYWGVFFDLDQGIILSQPVLLPLVIIFFIYYFIKNINKLTYESLLILTLIIMPFFYMSIGNWNPGESIINRYFVWTSMIVIGVYFYFFNINRFIFKIITSFLALTQCFCIFAFGGINQSVCGTNEHTKLAKWVLNNFPDYYNPDPTIFNIRTTEDWFGKKDNILYVNNKDKLVKILVYKDSISKLKDYGFTEDELNKISTRIRYSNGWAYLNKKQIPEHIFNETTPVVFLDMENLSNSKGQEFLINDSIVKIRNEYLLSNKESFSGENSIKLTAQNQYALTSFIKTKKGEKFRISVWRKQGKFDGHLVACAESSNEFYLETISTVETRDGWDRLQLNFVVPKISSPLKIYLWYNGNQEVYFDDFSIKKIK